MDAAGFIQICLAGWMDKNQQDVIEYLKEEVGVLKEPLGAKRGRFTDEQRGRPVRKTEKIRFGKLKEIATIATPSIRKPDHSTGAQERGDWWKDRMSEPFGWNAQL